MSRSISCVKKFLLPLSHQGRGGIGGEDDTLPMQADMLLRTKRPENRFIRRFLATKPTISHRNRVCLRNSL
jgi:hypothetical protein